MKTKLKKTMNFSGWIRRTPEDSGSEEVSTETILASTLNELNKESENPVKVGNSAELNELYEIDEDQKPNEGASFFPPVQNNSWFIIGASVCGHGHKMSGIPCQDAHKVELWGEDWGVAIVSDGAGSAKKSHISSAFLVEEAAKQVYKLVNDKKWKAGKSFPDQREWREEVIKLFDLIQDKLVCLAKEKKVPLADMHATLIMIIFSPKGLLVAHIGDGRAGYLDEKNDWLSAITPFEGDQVGETAFITLDFQKNDFLIESNVIKGVIKAFALLTDGCERVCWETIIHDPKSSKFSKPNKPFGKFFTQTIKALQFFHSSKTIDIVMKEWYNYLDLGHPGFEKETDDKTMIIAFNSKIEIS